jgi:hypothetical protein
MNKITIPSHLAWCLVALLIFTAPLHAAPTPTPKPKATAQSELPVARPVPGMPGHVYSPYAKGKIIAVAGAVMGIPNARIEYKHGEVVLCPYTGKKFRVP